MASRGSGGAQPSKRRPVKAYPIAQRSAATGKCGNSARAGVMLSQSRAKERTKRLILADEPRADVLSLCFREAAVAIHFDLSLYL